jgi:hypothetical protein
VLKEPLELLLKEEVASEEDTAVAVAVVVPLLTEEIPLLAKNMFKALPIKTVKEVTMFPEAEVDIEVEEVVVVVEEEVDTEDHLTITTPLEPLLLTESNLPHLCSSPISLTHLLMMISKAFSLKLLAPLSLKIMLAKAKDSDLSNSAMLKINKLPSLPLQVLKLKIEI